MKIVLVSFANKAYEPSLRRLEQELKAFDRLSEVFLFTERDLGSDFRRKFKPGWYRRGFGYWAWKPMLCARVMEELEEGDLLVYTDAGSSFDTRNVLIFNQWLDRVATSTSGILAVQDASIEHDFNKADCLDFLGVAHQEDVTETRQFMSGFWVMRKSGVTTGILQRWWEVARLRFDLFTDKASVRPNVEGFVEHRHDQSVFSVLLKAHPVESLPYTDFDKVESPVHFTRLKSMPVGQKCLAKGTQPFRYAIGCALVLFEGFQFRQRRCW